MPEARIVSIRTDVYLEVSNDESAVAEVVDLEAGEPVALRVCHSKSVTVIDRVIRFTFRACILMPAACRRASSFRNASFESTAPATARMMINPMSEKRIIRNGNRVLFIKFKKGCQRHVTIGLGLAVTAFILNSLPTNQPEDHGDDRDNQKNVDQRSCAVHKESKCPCDHQDHSNGIK